MIIALNLIFGLTNSGLVAAYTVAGEMHSAKTAGLALAIANMMTIMVGMIVNPFFGRLLDSLWGQHETIIAGVPVYMASDYRQAMLIMPFSLVAALLCTFYVKETLRK